mgnify:CR=1 FL=1
MARQIWRKNRSLHRVNEDSFAKFNAAKPSKVVFQHAATEECCIPCSYRPSSNKDNEGGAIHLFNLSIIDRSDADDEK